MNKPALAAVAGNLISQRATHFLLYRLAEKTAGGPEL